MEKNTKKWIHGMTIQKRVKRIIAGLAAAGITLTSTGCGLNDENVTHIQTPGMTGNSVSDDSSDEKTTTYESGVTGASTTYTTTVTTGRGFKGSDINTGERKSIGATSKKDDTNSSSKDDNTMSSNLKPSSDSNSSDSNDLNTGNDKDSNKDKTGRGGHSIAGNGGSGSGNSGSGSGNSGSGSKGNGTGNYTTPAVTTSTTSKPTTESTTSTTEATTTETEPPCRTDYSIDDICYDVDAFEFYSDSLLRDALYRNGGFYRGNSWNGSDCYYETRMMLLMLNEGLVSDDVIANVFSGCELNDITSSTLDYIFSFISAEDYYGGYVDFEQYACSSRKDVGRNINDMISLYRNNSFDEYINSINSFGLDGQYRENLLDMMMLYSFDSNHLCNQVDWEDIVDNHLYSLGDRINDLKRVYQK